MGEQEVDAATGPIESAAPERFSALEGLGIVREIAERLSATQDLAGVAEVVAGDVAGLLGADAVTLGRLSRDGAALDTLVARGFQPASEALVARPLVLGPNIPAADVVRDGAPLFWSSLSDRDRSYPSLIAYPSACEAWAILPLLARGAVTGVLSLGWAEPGAFGASDRELLRAAAHQCALALDRAEIAMRRQAERATLELLSEGTRLMVSAVEPHRIVRALVRLAVPQIAPYAAVYVREGAELVRVAVALEGGPAAVEALARTPTVALRADSPLADAFRSGSVVVVPRVTAELLRSLYGDGLGETYDVQAERATGLVVPISFAGEVVGVMSLASDAWAGTPPPEALFTAEGLAGRAGVALGNARRYEQERTTAALLTEALLPRAVPSIDGYELAARYLPAGSPVAGDWFDLAALPSGRCLVAVGDAGGHGIAAVSQMVQLRNAGRGIAVGGRPPSEVVAGLRLLTLEAPEASFATAIYAELEPPSGELRWASAGHLPPLHAVGGAAAYVPGEAEPPLSWPMSRAPRERQLRLDAGASLVLVTDGVVERRGVPLDEGMEKLRQVVVAAAGAGADELASAIAGSLCQSPEDDCCVVVVRRAGAER